jgi:hypothetical protein
MSSIRDQKVFGRFGHSEYLRDLYDKRALINAGAMEWGLLDYRHIQKNAISFRVQVKSWVCEFAASEPQDVDRLTETQKRTIISSLKGCCVQEDWDILMGRLSNLHRDLILDVFLETLLMKEIFTKFFDAPFWYLDGKMDFGDEKGDDTFGVRLQHLYERFLESMYTTAPFLNK